MAFFKMSSSSFFDKFSDLPILCFTFIETTVSKILLQMAILEIYISFGNLFLKHPISSRQPHVDPMAFLRCPSSLSLPFFLVVFLIFPFSQFTIFGNIFSDGLLSLEFEKLPWHHLIHHYPPQYFFRFLQFVVFNLQDF